MVPVFPTQLGPLEALVFRSPSFSLARPEQRLTLVLLHGFGVPGSDLSWLGRQLVDQETARGRAFQVVLPAGPLELQPGSESTGRLWFPIDMGAFQFALLERNWEKLAQYCPEGLGTASDALEQALDALAEQGVSRSALILGGFSQGALVAANTAFGNAAPPRGLVLLSAMMLCEKKWFPRLQKHAGLPVFQMHSPRDPVVPFELGARLASAMNEAGLQVTSFEAPPGHFVPASAAEELGAWLDSRFYPPGPSSARAGEYS
jgi:phospholipase/carboxylesterase